MDDLEPRDLYAMFAMVGWIINGESIYDEIPRLAYSMADAMIAARKPLSSGLPAIKRKPRK
jgi:hypothetical protein